MRTVKLDQGSTEWLEYRSVHLNASDAAAMLGISPYRTKLDLMAEYVTGEREEKDGRAQYIFARGHRLEAAARPGAEEITGQELFPAIGESEDWEKMSASFDGITIDESIVWEHKTLNDSIRDAAALDKVPDYINAQIQHQMFVSGAGKCLFSATSVHGERVDVWVKRDDEYIAWLVEEWKRFDGACRLAKLVFLAEGEE